MEDSFTNEFLYDNDLSFPTVGVMPKRETEATAFLQQYPNYDGRGVLVAILDTGCDPGSDGLLVTPDGKPKFVDVIDASGSGDIDTSSVVTMDAKTRIVTGLTGRKLKIPDNWDINEKNEFHIGLLRSYDVFPKVLTNRLNKDRSKKFDEIHGKKLDSLRNEIENMSKELKNNKDNKDKKDESKEKEESQTDRIDLKSKIEDAKKLLALLEKESCVNCGPVYDVLVWHTGNEWLGYVDTSSSDAYFNCQEFNNNNVIDISKYESSSSHAITNYRVRQEYCKMSSFDNVNYALNIYDNGNVVSIVVPAGSHGTHVAGIVGAYFKDDASKNGIAPGCQLVSIKIGDTRLGSMETNQGLLRAVAYLKELKCDLANMSYGEPTTYPFSGAFPDAINDLVRKYGTIFVSSAGNAGPCLSTAGAPQASTNSIIGIGAMFTPAMLEADYCLANSQLPTNTYTWSSRGPTTGGALGVKLCAPGGAIAPVPTFTLNKHQLMNGTSMSSPNACGNIALLLSGLKQRDIKYSPNGIETALINTSKLLPNYVEKISYGYGLIQILKAFNYCIDKELIQTVIEKPVYFNIKVNGGPYDECRNEKGIYLRECDVLGKCEHSYTISIDPIFHDIYTNDEKTNFELKCSLKTTQPSWVTCANYALIAHGGRGFQVKINTKSMRKYINGMNLKSNGYKAYYSAEILGFDSNNLKAGPLFRIPITVVNPIVYPTTISEANSKNNNFDNSLANWSFSDNDANGIGSGNNNDDNGSSLLNTFQQTDDFRVGTIARVFHAVPQGVCCAKLTVTAVKTGSDKPTRFSVATLYNKGYQCIDYDRWIRVTTGGVYDCLFQVEPSTVLETTITQYTLDDNVCRLHWKVEFIGPVLSSDHIYLNENLQYSQLSMQTNAITAMNLKPSISFDRYVTYVNPKFATTGSLSRNRGDISVNDELYYYLELEYEFESECSGDTIFTLVKIANLLYESYLGGAFYQIFNKYNKLIGWGEGFRETISMEKNEKYTYKVQIRHTSLKELDTLKTLQLQIDYPLGSSLSSDIYFGRQSLLLGKNKVSSISLSPYSNRKMYITPPSKDTPIKSVKTGDFISGWLKLDSNAKNALKPRFRNTGTRGDASLCIPIDCVLAAANTKNQTPKSKNDDSKGNGKGDKDDENDKPSLEDKQRDAMIDWINKLKGKEQIEAFEKYVTNGLKKAYPKHLPLLELEMNVYAANMKDNDKESEKYTSMVGDACDAILSAIDPIAVSAHFGRNGNSDDKEWCKADKKYKEEKEFIIKALFQKLKILYNSLTNEDNELKKAAIADDSDLATNEYDNESVTTVNKNNNNQANNNDEKSEILTNDSSYINVTSGNSGPLTASKDGHSTGITANGNYFENVIYDRKDKNINRMVFLNSKKLEEFNNLVKEISQWTSIEKNKSLKDDYFDMKLWYLKQEQKYGEMLQLISENDYNGDKKKLYDEKLNVLKNYFSKSFGYLIEQKELAKYQEFPKQQRLF